MTPEIIPLLNEPALSVKNRETALVLADIHLGIEWDLYKSGYSVPSQLKGRLARIRKYIEETSPDRIVLLGDIKHNVPQVSWQEKDEIPYFLETLAGYASLDILPGNHDGGIEFLFDSRADIKLHPAKGAVLDGVGYFHGHTWPTPELLTASHVITAHNHPTVRFTDSFGYSTTEPAWIKTRFRPEKLKAHFNFNLKKPGFENGKEEEGKGEKKGEGDLWANPEVFIMPAFNELCGGVAFNEALREDLLGPVFTSGSLELEAAEVYLLDGTRLGAVRNLRKLEHTRSGPKAGKSKKIRKNSGKDSKRKGEY